jgi:2'-5' RNA ligase
MPRLFTAIEIPPAVAADLALMRGGLAGARWIDPENYHLTLRFIGDVDAAMARDVHAVLAGIRRPSFAVTLAGVSAFGGAKPRAIVVTAKAETPLVALQAEQESLMRRSGLVPEARKFRPHITLARLRRTPSVDVAAYLADHGLAATWTFPITRFVLFSARDSIGGGPYVGEAVYPLT